MNPFQQTVHDAMNAVLALSERADLTDDEKRQALALANLLEDVAHCGYKVEEVADDAGWSEGYIVVAPPEGAEVR